MCDKDGEKNGSFWRAKTTARVWQTSELGHEQSVRVKLVVVVLRFGKLGFPSAPAYSWTTSEGVLRSACSWALQD